MSSRKLTCIVQSFCFNTEATSGGTQGPLPIWCLGIAQETLQCQGYNLGLLHAEHVLQAFAPSPQPLFSLSCPLSAKQNRLLAFFLFSSCCQLAPGNLSPPLSLLQVPSPLICYCLGHTPCCSVLRAPLAVLWARI